jgi:hypothetical protein
MRVPINGAQAPSAGVAEFIPTQRIDDGLPECAPYEDRLPSGIPLDAHTRVARALSFVSGEWIAVGTDYQRTEATHVIPPKESGTRFSRWREARKQRQLEQLAGRQALSAKDILPHHTPVMRIV